ncbi:MAG: glycerol-3-phosphate 1-O-acyltransferase PlsY [Legionellaceae bacterium]|nr:glycerol-3-phosphate 1-O-acyltransferase PlsY [Legionellaceae bacterium]
MKTIVIIIAAYGIGSISSAIIMARLFDLPDPRLEGSKNPGATNMLRLAGKKYAAVVMAVDLLKGFLPLIIAKLLAVNTLTLGYVALAAVLGHMFPLFFSLRGGKGVATAIGAALGLQFILGFMVAATWLIVARLSHYSSLASMIAMMLMPLYAVYTTGHITLVTPLFFITLLILYKHRENINRLIDGEESKIDFARFLKNAQSKENTTEES